MNGMRLLLCNYMGFTPAQIARLEALGFEVLQLAREDDPCPEAYLDVEAVAGYQVFNYHDIRLFRHLKLIHTTSAGLDHMPLDYIREHNITLYNARGVFSIPMAEFALGGVLQLYKRAPLFRRQQTAHLWQPTRTLLELWGKRVCIVGAGSIGTECARRFSAMGCHVTGLCRHPEPKPCFDAVRSIGELDAVLAESDVVILTLPLTAETRHLFDAGRFAAMKEGAVLVNMARGPICDTKALLSALEAGRLLGAVLDVFETEPLPADSPLWERGDVIMTPHNSFHSEGNNERMMDLLCRDLEAWRRA